jgi:hypothetical protein
VLSAHAALVVLPPAFVAAEAATGGSPDIVQLITALGFPTALVVAWMFGWVVSGREHDRVIRDRDEERAERIRLQTAMSERAIPALTRQTLVMEAALPLLEERVRLRAARELNPEDV